MTGSESLTRLIKVLSRLPGVGRRSAERMAVRIAIDQKSLVREMIEALQYVESNVSACDQCAGITLTSQNPCRICSDPRRDGHIVCVVEDPGDISLLERSGAFHGVYHALMGRLSPMKGEGPQQLRLQQLHQRIHTGGVTEVILALNSDMESDATAHFIEESLKDTGVRVTRLAFGLPAGSGIGYSDPITLSRALEGRQPLGGNK